MSLSGRKDRANSDECFKVARFNGGLVVNAKATTESVWSTTNQGGFNSSIRNRFSCKLAAVVKTIGEVVTVRILEMHTTRALSERNQI